MMRNYGILTVIAKLKLEQQLKLELELLLSKNGN
jgi:hypothetical protein